MWKFLRNMDLSQALTRGVVVVSMIGVVTGFIGSIVTNWRASTGMAPVVMAPFVEPETLEKMNKLARQVEVLTALVHAATESPQSLEVAKLDSDLKQVSNDVETIKSALGSDLERSLSIPLLRKDLQQLSGQIDTTIDIARSEVDRIQKQNNWFLTFMGSLMVGFFAVIIQLYRLAQTPAGRGQSGRQRRTGG
jgi:hypothetical protein